jgi:hypothetical protein
MYYATLSREVRWSRLAVVLLPLLAAGCTHTEKGALVGGGLGAVAGTAVGCATGNPLAGAAIGTGIGGVGGAVVGNQIDQSEARTDAKIAAATAAPPPPVQGPLAPHEIVHMAQQHIADDIIIQQIRSTGSVYALTSQDIIGLRQQGVSEGVIREMQLTSCRGPRRVYSAAPVYAPTVVQPVYVYEPPPPPVSVGFGLGFTNVGGCGRRCR